MYVCNRCGTEQPESDWCRYCGWGDMYPIKPKNPEGNCCALNCGKPLSNKFLPFCDEHMKDETLVKAWNEL